MENEEEDESKIIVEGTVIKHELLLDKEEIETYVNLYDSYFDVKEEFLSEDFCDNKVFTASTLQVICIKEEIDELEGPQVIPEQSEQQTQLLNNDLSTRLHSDKHIPENSADKHNMPADCVGSPLAIKDYTTAETSNICKMSISTRKRQKRQSLFCNHCSFNSLCKAKLERHIHKQHGKEINNLTCRICMQKFTLKGNLVRHMKLHSGVKPFACDICGYKFRWKFRLDNHMIIHSSKKNSEKRFLCHICNNKYTTKSNLKVHIRKHSGVKPFGCDICEKRYLTKDSLVVHMRVHTGVKPFSCLVCSYSSRYKDGLQLHMKRSH